MRTFITVFAGLTFSHSIFGIGTPLVWARTEGNSVEFSVGNRMSHHYETPVVEILISAPERFTGSIRTRLLEEVKFISKSFSSVLATHNYMGKQRVIITISEHMTEDGHLLFYYRNAGEERVRGVVYVLELPEVIQEWKMSAGVAQ